LSHYNYNYNFLSSHFFQVTATGGVSGTNAFNF